MNANEPVQLAARYPGRCRECGGGIAVGDQILYARGEGARHVECPERPTVDDALTPGVYELNGEIFVVKPTKDGERLYAKRMVEVELGVPRVLEDGTLVRYDVHFEYEAGAIFKIREEHRMPLDRAKMLVIRYGRCINCGRRLKAATSVERGIGPVCIKRFAPVAA